MKNELEVTFNDILQSIEQVKPSGRSLTAQEQKCIENWPESRKKYFELSIQYGDPDLIPAKEIQLIQKLALSEIKQQNSVENKVIIEEEPYINDGHLNFETLWENYPKRPYEKDGYIAAKDLANRLITNQDIFNKILKEIKNYAKANKKTEKQYILRFDRFLSNTLSTLGQSSMKNRSDIDESNIDKKPKLHRLWLPANRIEAGSPLPWDPEPGDTPEDKLRKQKLLKSKTNKERTEIEERLKKKLGYYDTTNTFWYR